MDIREQILIDREKRIDEIKAMHSTLPIVCLKANIVGNDKNIKEAKIITTYFKNIILELYDVKQVKFFESKDGNYYLFEIKKTPEKLKKELVELETKEPFGRLIDLDVFQTPTKSISRSDLRLNKRKCIICKDDVAVCTRAKKHTVEEVLEKTIEIIKKDYAKVVDELAKDAMSMEVSCEHKLGLVTKNSKGSHKDMSVATFVQSITAIDLKKFALAGFEELNFDNLREIGIEVENKMFKETEGINTHKGLIFLYGLFIPAYTKHLLDGSNWNETVSSLCKDIFKDFDTATTAGAKAYKESGVKGIREIAKDGLVIINDYIAMPMYGDDHIRELLRIYMSKIDDTTIIKRGGMEALNWVKSIAPELNTVSDFKKYTKMFIEKNLSPGGAADLVALTLLADMLDERFGD